MTDFVQIDCMTLYEYELRMRAHWLETIDKEYEIHLQAWVNWNVQATKKQGKNKEVPVYKTFKQFFDYQKAIESVSINSEGTTQEKRLKQIAFKVQEYQERKGENGII